MKKLFIFLAILLVFPLITSASIEMKDSYNREETLIAKVTGLFYTPVTAENVFFYRGTLKIALDFEVFKIGDDFYISAPLKGKIPGNYSLSIEGVRYYSLENKDTQLPFSKSFSISTNLTDFSVSKGVIVTNTDFSINIQNYKPITLNIKTPTGIVTQNKFEMTSVQKKILYFRLDNLQKDLVDQIEIDSGDTKYTIPLSVYGVIPTPIECTKDSECKSDELCKDSACVAKPECEKDNDCKDDKICDQNKCVVKVECVNDSGCDDGYLCENNTCITKPECVNNSECNLNRTGYVCENEKCVDEIGQKSCQDLNGTTCLSIQTCEGNSSIIRGYSCCVGVCKEKTSDTGSTAKVIGWGLLILALVLLVWFYLKYKRTNKGSPNIGSFGKTK